MTFLMQSLNHQSQNISLDDWITLLTLCLAPLLAHIFSGAPEPSYVCSTRPKWHDRICFYNPTTIIWRYMAVVDRRIRARVWTPLDMAASNALFWTTKGWDGSEQMIVDASIYCTYLPEHPRLQIISTEALKTTITTLQGLQFMYRYIPGTPGYLGDRYFAVDSIFTPLACFGLIRLLAAAWLTGSFAYTPRPIARVDLDLSQLMSLGKRCSFDSLQENHYGVDDLKPRYYELSCRRSRSIRVLNIVLLTSCWFTNVVCFILIPTFSANPHIYTVTDFLTSVFYFIMSTMTFAVCTFYLSRGHTMTIIPCISRPWYKAYTIGLAVMLLVLVIVACIETRKVVCGKFTSVSAFYANADPCLAEASTIIQLDANSNTLSAFGITLKTGKEGSATLLDEGFWYVNFSGTCLGKATNPADVRESIQELANIPST
ncbi:hypothetical protein BKA67DRAFT_562160 [Truncatella angustata]|uniref:Uncharacterized protein n=1 Tax=Truncatella angustata TaxID=152316 RepID=A0A9P8UPU4_9PEZI|nr:uncharacterized protein BKA67DRAFT_562160 [Truncatella angustata]KAH6655916.1 hypothetical protein BKA67DRAFT_562160 [Truncatella angustata]